MKHLIRRISVVFTLILLSGGCCPPRTSLTLQSFAAYDTVYTIPVHEDCPPWEQPSKKVVDIDFMFTEHTDMLVFYYPCNGVERLVLYQIRFRDCGPIYRYEYRDTCY